MTRPRQMLSVEGEQTAMALIQEASLDPCRRHVAEFDGLGAGHFTDTAADLVRRLVVLLAIGKG